MNPFNSDRDLQAYLQRARAGFRRDPGVHDAGTDKPGPPASPKPEYESKWEEAYAYNLDLQKKIGIILDWRIHPIKFRLAKATFYTPDFLVITCDAFEIHEVKGYMRDDAAVKLKTAAEMFPWFRWYLIRWEKTYWDIKEIGGGR